MPGALGIIASSAGWTPKSVPDLQMWFDADNAATIEYGVAPKVQAWNDLSTNAWRFFNTAPAEYPSLTSGGLKTGRNSLDFLTGMALNGPSSSGVNQKPLTCFAALKHTGSATDRAMLGTIYTNGFLWEIRTDHRQLVNQHNTANIGNSTSVVPTSTTALIAVSYSATGQLAFYLNNVADGSVTNDKAFTASTEQSRVGTGSGSAQSYIGTIGEILKYARVLSTTERDAVYNYLAVRWL